MRNRWLLVATVLVLGVPSLKAQTNQGVLLPPLPASDETVKAPNNTRESYGQWSISGGVYYMQPVFGSNPAFVVNSAGGNVGRQVDFSQHLDIAHNVWLGYVSERGWGIRGRWFEFDHGSDVSYAAAPGETIAGISSLGLGRVPIDGTINAYSHLAVKMFDLQATCSIDGPRWSHLLGIGVRYTHMSQDYRATLSNAATEIDLSAGHNLNSVGPSFALETKRRIGEKGFAIYGQMNGAILFGDAKEAYSAVNNGVPQGFTGRHNEVLPVGELEIGAEYERNMGRAKLFVQAGFIGQIWWGGGNASNLDAVGPTSASNSNFGFIGVAVRAGVRY
jgi:hypothetical protein